MTDNSKKVPDKLNCFIDNEILYYGTKTYPIYRKFNMTPNDLTTISLLLGLMSIYFFYNKFFILSSLFYFLSYVYDVLDGNYARKYKMVSKFGDLYDHFKDITVNLLLLYVFYNNMTFKNHTNLMIFSFIITFILFITLNLHLGCQEIYLKKHKNNKNNSDFLKFTTLLCNDKVYENMHILRYFGTGTFIVWISFLILLNKFYL